MAVHREIIHSLCDAESNATLLIAHEHCVGLCIPLRPEMQRGCIENVLGGWPRPRAPPLHQLRAAVLALHWWESWTRSADLFLALDIDGIHYGTPQNRRQGGSTAPLLHSQPYWDMKCAEGDPPLTSCVDTRPVTLPSRCVLSMPVDTGEHGGRAWGVCFLSAPHVETCQTGKCAVSISGVAVRRPGMWTHALYTWVSAACRPR